MVKPRWHGLLFATGVVLGAGFALAPEAQSNIE